MGGLLKGTGATNGLGFLEPWPTSSGQALVRGLVRVVVLVVVEHRRLLFHLVGFIDRVLEGARGLGCRFGVGQRLRVERDLSSEEIRFGDRFARVDAVLSHC